MNRNSFLSSLPFLLPTYLNTYPRADEYSVEVILKDNYWLSIEPIASKGPAFFSTKDPAACPVELALVRRSALEEEEDVAESLPLFSLNEKPDPSTPSSLSLLLRIDGKIYALDARKLHTPRFEKSPPGETKPDSLLFKFSTCKFRIYSKYKEDQSHLVQAKESIESLVRNDLKEAWMRGLVELESSSIDSPSSSTTAHKESQGGSTSTEDPSQPKRKNSPFGDDSPVIVRKVKRRQERQSECQHLVSKLNKISQCLNHHVWQDEFAHHRGAVCSLMTKAADARAESYSSPADIRTAAVHWMRQDPTKEVDAILDAYFAKPGGSQVDATENSRNPESTVEKVSSLLARRMEVVQERANLLLIPTRGSEILE